jgi:hypothetical protein
MNTMKATTTNTITIIASTSPVEIDPAAKLEQLHHRLGNQAAMPAKMKIRCRRRAM